MAHQR
ncbi:hypothetical protein EE612_047545 [Oryza sativa]